MNERRIKRLQEQIKARIAEVLMRELADPDMGLVTISRVELDREFTQCKAYWSVIGNQHQRAHSERALKRACGFIQREIGATLHTRTVPRLTFVFDEGIAGAIRIQDMLRGLREERQEREDAAPQAESPEPAEDQERPAEEAPEGDTEPRPEP